MTPSIEISPSVTPEIGLQCSLTCTVTGVEHYNPAVTFQWFKNGVMILNATDSVLTIQALKHTDAGEYMCIVNMSSEKLIPSFISNINNTFVMCFTLGMPVCVYMIFTLVHCSQLLHVCKLCSGASLKLKCMYFYTDIGVTIAGSSISNQSLIYFDEITKQDSTSALVCHVNNIIPCDNGTNNSQIGNWYFPNGDLVPQRTATQTISTMFSQRSLGGTELHRFGHPSQTGHYFCTVPSTSIKFYVFISKKNSWSYSCGAIYHFNNVHFNVCSQLTHYNSITFLLIGSHVSLSLRGVIIYNNSYLNFGDIGGIIDDEALQCHTDNVNCCNNELITENGSVLAEWYYPNGSKVLSVDHTDNSTNDSYVSGDGIFTSRSQSVIRLLAGRGSTESGLYCCEILDQYGSSQTVCVNLGKN